MLLKSDKKLNYISTFPLITTYEGEDRKMSKKKPKITIEELQVFEPISVLSAARLEELQGLVDIEVLGVGVSIFREGDVDDQSVYLLDGDIQTTSVSEPALNSSMTHKSHDAKHPLAEGQPRQVTCTAMTLAKVLRIDNSILDYMLTWDQLAVAEEPEPKVEESKIEETVVVNKNNKTHAADKPVGSQGTEKVEDGQNWIRRMRHIMAFKNMPPANIKTLLQKMETVSVKDNEVIIEQGSPGDFYYVLTEGEARVTRTVELASLEAGASFGEEALLSGAKRNASVTMSSEGQLMRLAKEDFNELLKEPLLDRVTPDEAQVRVAKGNTWLDVRHVTEFNHSHLQEAVNIPLHELRMRIRELDKDKEYICYCGTGRRSSAAAFLLVQNGFKVVVLIGGVQKIPQFLVKG